MFGSIDYKLFGKNFEVHSLKIVTLLIQLFKILKFGIRDSKLFGKIRSPILEILILIIENLQILRKW